MTPKEKLDALIRKEVRELLKRHVYFSQEILTLVSQNFHLKKRLSLHNKKLQRLTKKVRRLKMLINAKKRKP